MDKYLRIKQQLKKLKQQKLEAEQLVAITKGSIDKKNLEIAQYYQDFFKNKKNTEFVFYDRFPSAEALKLYVQRISSEFPLYEVGDLNVKELAEIVKHFYQFQRGPEYDILTIGSNEHHGSPVYGGQSWSIRSHMYFIIGDDKTLAPFREYDGKYINEDKVYTSIFLTARGKDLISIELENGYNLPNIDIECLTGSNRDIPKKINYFNYEENDNSYCDFSKSKNIFEYQLSNRVGQTGRYGYNGIKDVLDFAPHISDTFIAKMLISICIYKQNNNIEELTNEDYNHIFDVLYKEKVDIIGQADKDIPKKLIYVPNSKYQK